MRSWTRSTLALRTALHKLLSPTFGVNPATEPVLAWLLRGQTRTARRTAIFLLGGAAVMLVLILLLRWAFGMLSVESALGLCLLMRPLALDIPALNRAMGQLGPAIRSGRWDMLRLTAQTEGALLRAFQAASGAAAWPLTIALLGAQTAAIAVALIWLPLYTGIEAGLVEILLSGAALAVVFGVELFYRRRALVDLGLSISAASTRGGTAVILGGLALTLWWGLQVALLALGLLASSPLLFLIDPFNTMLALIGSGVVGVLFLITLHGFVDRLALVRLTTAIVNRDHAA